MVCPINGWTFVAFKMGRRQTLSVRGPYIKALMEGVRAQTIMEYPAKWF